MPRTKPRLPGPMPEPAAAWPETVFDEVTKGYFKKMVADHALDTKNRIIFVLLWTRSSAARLLLFCS